MVAAGSLDQVALSIGRSHGQANSYCVSFLVQAIYDTLPSPANLHTWGRMKNLDPHNTSLAAAPRP